jgi:hypothetical protein
LSTTTIARNAAASATSRSGCRATRPARARRGLLLRHLSQVAVTFLRIRPSDTDRWTTTTYQWQMTSDGGVTWTDIPGAAATTYTPPAGQRRQTAPRSRHRNQRRRQQPSRRQPCRQNRLPSGPSPSANSPSPSKRSRTLGNQRPSARLSDPSGTWCRGGRHPRLT